MQPEYISVMAIFTQQTRYTVPLFQRPYVWQKDDQWQPLWEDVKGAAERVLNAQGKRVPSHFLGTIVLEQTLNATFSLPRREIIDGQQRLTTLQIVLKAAEHALAELYQIAKEDTEALRLVDVAARQIAPLTYNPAVADEDEKYKVFPTNEDRPAFKDVMDCRPDKGPKFAESHMAQAYKFFRDEFREWLKVGPYGVRAQALSSSLKDHLRLIVLDLDSTDEPQAIFETLNAHGTPLLPADLIKNWLLWEAARQELAIDKLYNGYWHQFDREMDYWRTLIGTGHAARARVDTFLGNWLTRKVRQPIPAKHLYSSFISYVRAEMSEIPPLKENGKVDVEALMSDIAENAKRFRIIEKPTGNSRFDIFLRRLAVMDITVFHPVLMEVMGRQDADAADLDAFGVALESYLLRRLVCGFQTRGYGKTAITLLEALHIVPGDQSVSSVIRATLAALSESDRWPDDETFKLDWTRKKFYGYLRRNRVVMILRAIEETYQDKNTMSEPVLTFNFDALEVEHILPQAWEEHWPLGDSVSRDDRNWILHGIGNLTLVGKKLNPSLSNGPWTADEGLPSKTAGLKQHSKLEMNAKLLKEYPRTWDENTIKARAEALFEIAKQIWPIQ